MPVGPPKVGGKAFLMAMDFATSARAYLLTKANPAKAGDAKLRD
jgi:hypothetical protein